jgi:hypothetical protein
MPFLRAFQHRQTMPIKLDEGTLLAVLNAAAHERDALLARMAWNMLVSILLRPSASADLHSAQLNLAEPDSRCSSYDGGTLCQWQMLSFCTLGWCQQ